MTKQSLSNDDYQSLKVFLDRHFEWYTPKYPTTPVDTPSQFLARIEATSLANAKKGLQMAINDIVEESADWTPQQVAAADMRFSAVGTFTLSEVRQRYSKKYLQILKRGTIRSETEYYLVKGIVDGGGIEPGATEATQLQAMMSDFEAQFATAQQQKRPASE
ncbi:hypothetical protein APR50_42255 [Variovorax paradoxus]|jgi:peptide subunit release factor RF-3|uniref:hypothetical protein n=1 Tax=Variovorax paradoxus TaxID=34073 RepID=UPI0006E56505|nr:hypothetical protein APR50_42255 [Variovorax paradoxus]KPU96895.1 hypothetical protein APR49_36335 [Variovorax paradoxus]KPV03311.1 hypothetical protein APR51_44680 [Variovorax paradoxus]KPV23367.1 hypothetical protein APR48_35690 [Variovorax paradoxus]KPV26078.1 hypothetical protein APR47_34195 [Variovorax paradoxus]